MRIGMIGFGTIGRAVARALSERRAGNAGLAAVLVRDVEKARATGITKPGMMTTADPDEFFTSEIDVVVEVAGHVGLKLYAARALLSGLDVLAVSVGAFADDDFHSSVRQAAEENRRRLLVPSGALGGLDAISAASVGALDQVVLVARKPPGAWKGTPAEDAASQAVTEPICSYARSSARGS